MWRALYRLICGLAPADHVVNSLIARQCLIKPFQQRAAALAGFRVPASLVTNDKSAAERMVEVHDSVIMKSLSATKVRPASEGEFIPFNVLTLKVTQDDVAAATSDEIAFCPHFFQEYVSKDHESRVVYVDGEMLAFKIDSQKYRLSTLDWRKGLDIIDFSPVTLPNQIEEKIRLFMKGVGLFAGSLDLIVSDSGEVYFLECNQEGAWGWLDDLDDGRVTRAFARAFISRSLALAERGGPSEPSCESIHGEAKNSGILA